MSERGRSGRPQTIAAEDFEPDAYCIRSCGPGGESYGSFKWPLEVGAVVTCPDWLPTAECGNGLHGLLDGIGDWSLIDDGADRIWQIVGVIRAEVVAIDESKGKFPRGKIVYIGTASGALAWIQPKMAEAILEKAKGNTATEYSGHAAATGEGGHAAATGDRGHAAATGYSGHAAATGYSGHAAATGEGGHAAATGDSGHAAATGKNAIAVSLGITGSATAGEDGWVVLAAWDDDFNLVMVRAAKVGGPEGIKPGVSYRLTVAGEFDEATP